MDIAAKGTQPHLDEIMLEIARHDLGKHALDLASYGFTVVPPETLGVSEQWVGRLREAILRTCEQRTGVELGDWRTSKVRDPKLSGQTWQLMKEDDVFAEAAMNPAALALIQYLLGRSAILGGNTWIIKSRNRDFTPLHTDQHGISLGMGHTAQLCNASWLCTDYVDEDDGPTIVVPGSFREGRATRPHEMDPETSPYSWTPILGRAGSLAIWHGGLWHGSIPRNRVGLRITLVQTFMRAHLQRMNRWDDVTSEQLERNPGLAKLLGLESTYPYGEYNPHPERVPTLIAPGLDPFA